MLICSYSTNKSNKLKLTDKVIDGYLYSGSHNTSKAAWGQIQKSSIRISNWELGIVIPFEWTKNEDEFELPFEYPPKPYTKDDLPWSSGAFYANNKE